MAARKRNVAGKQNGNEKVKATFPWPVGTVCRRDRRMCESYTYDGRCGAKACPFRDQ